MSQRRCYKSLPRIKHTENLPVSSSPFVSKTLEKVAVKRLIKHLTDNGLHDDLQSAYKAIHSTDTQGRPRGGGSRGGGGNCPNWIWIWIFFGSTFVSSKYMLTLHFLGNIWPGLYMVQFIHDRSYPARADWD